MSSDAETNDPLARYAKQTRFLPIGEEGQWRLLASRVLLVGCGALGSVLAETLTRAGVGMLRIADRDVVELSNLQRQTLFTEADAACATAKAVAAADRLRAINSTVEVDPHVTDVTHRNLPALADGVDLLLDGADNFGTRLLVNDCAHATQTPWVYAGVVGAEGRVMPIVPGETACLACLLPEVPGPGETETCDSAGVIGPAVNVVASIAAAEAIKLLVGDRTSAADGLTVVDLWSSVWRRIAVKRAGDCRVCQQGKHEWLDGEHAVEATVLCGQHAVQLSPPPSGAIDLTRLRGVLAPYGAVTGNALLLRGTFEGRPLTLFADGRTIVGGVETEAEARSVLARCLGQ